MRSVFDNPVTERQITAGVKSYADLGLTPATILSLLIGQAPFFFALLGSMTAASIAQTLVGNEKDRGGLELLLAAP